MPNPTLTVGVKGDISGLDASLEGATSTINAFGAAIPTTRIEALVSAGKKVVEFAHNLSVQGREASAAEDLWANSMTTLGASAEDLQNKLIPAVDAAMKMGFTDDEARGALESLTRATGDINAAMDLLPKVMDLARNNAADLATTADKVAVAMGTNATLGVTRMVAGMTKGEDTMATLDEAFALSAGAATTWAATTQGQAEIAKIALSETAEAAGVGLSQAFASVREALGPLLVQLGQLLNELLPFIVPLITAMADALGRVLDFVTKVVAKASEFIGFIEDVIAKLGTVDEKLAEIMPDFLTLSDGGGLVDTSRDWRWEKSGSAATGSGKSRAAGGTAGSTAWAPFTINIYGDTAAIEAKVTSAIRNYNRRNGAGAIFSPGRS